FISTTKPPDIPEFCWQGWSSFQRSSDDFGTVQRGQLPDLRSGAVKTAALTKKRKGDGSTH
ncbi:hypothetical protein, partial [Ferrovum myxofaciens]|uniref:hypothetical protein n=1 Tax=Ferrovum myxofaciens TaxID=416213 RepID=UPI000552B2AA